VQLCGDVELRQLEHFLAVVEEGSFTRAAARVFLVQSSLSASLLALERELGADLFIRGRRGAELTDAGRALIEPARSALRHAERARDAVAEVQGLLRGTVRIAIMVPPRIVDVIETLRRFHDAHPGVHINVIPTDGASVAEQVTSGAVDFAIAPRIDRAGSAIRFEPLMSAPLVVICPAGHRLAGARDVDPEELVDESIIDLLRGWQSRELFDRMLAAGGVRRQVRLEVDDWLGVLTLVQRGMGITYGLEDSIDDEIFAALHVATLAGAPVLELGVAYRDESLRGAAGRAFLDAYREQGLDLRGGRGQGAPDRCSGAGGGLSRAERPVSAPAAPRGAG
jgi:DNA-binding transcriptional LysR family regulator